MSPLKLHHFMFCFEHTVTLSGKVCENWNKQERVSVYVSAVQRNTMGSLHQTVKSLSFITIVFKQILGVHNCKGGGGISFQFFKLFSSFWNPNCMKIMQMYKTMFNINHESIIGSLSFKKSYKLQLKLYGY